jgi:hypothetical protein
MCHLVYAIFVGKKEHFPGNHVCILPTSSPTCHFAYKIVICFLIREFRYLIHEAFFLTHGAIYLIHEANYLIHEANCLIHEANNIICAT